MSERQAGGAGRGGGGYGRGRGRGRGGRSNQASKKAQKYTSNTPAIKNDVFECGKPEHVALFKKSKKAIVNYIRMSGERESATVANIIENMAEEGIPIPPAPPQIEDPNNQNQNPPVMIEDATQTFIWQGKLKLIASRELNLDQGIVQAFAIVHDQCSKNVKEKIKQLPNYDKIMLNKNPMALLEEIRNIICGRERHKPPIISMVQLIKAFCYFYQHADTSNEDYVEQFEALWETVEQQGGNLTNHPGLIADRALEIAEEVGRNAALDQDVATATEQIANEMKAAFMLSGAEKNRHKQLKSMLENAFVVEKKDNYPNNTADVLNMMNNFQGVVQPQGNSYTNWQQQRQQQQQRGDDDGVAFIQGADHDEEGGEQEGATFLQDRYSGDTGRAQRPQWRRQGKKNNTGTDQRKVNPAKQAAKNEKEVAPQAAPPPTCMHCGGAHELAACPDLTNEQLGQILVQIIAAEEGQSNDNGNDDEQDRGSLQQVRGQGENAGLKNNYLYLDTCTTDDVACNEAYLSRLHKVTRPLRLHTNAGATRLEKKGYLGRFPFWLDRFGIAIVISLTTLESAFHVSYDSKKDGGAFVAHTSKGPITFKRCEDTGFPFIDLDNDGSEAAVMLVQSIRKNFEGYTRKEVERAIEARKLQNMTGMASEGAFKNEVSRKPIESNLFKDSSVKPADIAVARKIFGPSDCCLKGKWVRGKPKRVDEGIVSIPASVMERCRDLTLAADVMFVCGLPFLITLSRKVWFVTVQYVPCRTAPELANAIKNVLKIYYRSGFKPRLALMDGEFDKLRQRLADSIEINVTGKNEHVGEIERLIRQVKERCRCVRADIRFKILPNAVIKALVIHVVMWLNAWPSKAGVSEIFSPREIVLRWQLSTKLHCQAPFGSYCIAYDENIPTNTQQLRGRDCICLGPTGNRQGTYKFLDLETWQVIKRKQFKEYPFPKSFISKVEAKGRKEKQDGRLKFANRRNVEFDWSLEDEEEPLIEDNAVEPEAPYPDIPAEMPGVMTEEQVPAIAGPEGVTWGEDEIFEKQDQADAAARNADFGPAIAAIVGNRIADQAQAREAEPREMTLNVNLVPAEDQPIDGREEAERDREEESDAGREEESDDDESFDPAIDGDAEEDDHELPQDFAEGGNEDDDDEENAMSDGEREKRDAYVGRSRRARSVRGLDRLNLAQARKRTGVHKGKRNETESESCSETESETESESEDEAKEKGTRIRRAPIPLGMLSPRVATTRAVTELVKRVYGDQEGDTPIIVHNDETEVMGIIMMQLSLKQGLQEWGGRAEKSAIKEMQQMHDIRAFFPRDPKSLTRQERQRALRSIIFMKEKRDKSIKTRACINRAPQRAYIPKEDAASPTAWTDSLFITGVIDAK